MEGLTEISSQDAAALFNISRAAAGVVPTSGVQGGMCQGVVVGNEGGQVLTYNPLANATVVSNAATTSFALERYVCGSAEGHPQAAAHQGGLVGSPVDGLYQQPRTGLPPCSLPGVDHDMQAGSHAIPTSVVTHTRTHALEPSPSRSSLAVPLSGSGTQQAASAGGPGSSMSSYFQQCLSLPLHSLPLDGANLQLGTHSVPTVHTSNHLLGGYNSSSLLGVSIPGAGLSSSPMDSSLWPETSLSLCGLPDGLDIDDPFSSFDVSGSMCCSLPGSRVGGPIPSLLQQIPYHEQQMPVEDFQSSSFHSNLLRQDVKSGSSGASSQAEICHQAAMSLPVSFQTAASGTTAELQSCAQHIPVSAAFPGSSSDDHLIMQDDTISSGESSKETLCHEPAISELLSVTEANSLGDLWWLDDVPPPVSAFLNDEPGPLPSKKRRPGSIWHSEAEQSPMATKARRLNATGSDSDIWGVADSLTQPLEKRSSVGRAGSTPQAGCCKPLSKGAAAWPEQTRWSTGGGRYGMTCCPLPSWVPSSSSTGLQVGCFYSM